MKKFAFLLLMSVQLNAQTVPTQLPKYIQDVAPKVIEMRRYFHQFPELSNREFQTAAKIEAYMKEFGIETKYIDYDTQFEKAFEEPLKTILNVIGWQIRETNSLESMFA